MLARKDRGRYATVMGNVKEFGEQEIMTDVLGADLFMKEEQTLQNTLNDNKNQSQNYSDNDNDNDSEKENMKIDHFLDSDFNDENNMEYEQKQEIEPKNDEIITNDNFIGDNEVLIIY